MNKFIHTPGPWYVRLAPFNGGAKVIDKNDKIIAIRDCIDGVGIRMSIGDAMLIATAPEMLDILIKLLDHSGIIGTSEQKEISKIVQKATGLEIE